MTTKLDPSRNYSYLAIAALFGFLGFMMEPTAYTWGEQDMMPFFERVFDANFLTNDFFTNTTVAKNPRWVYGYFVVALSRITTLHWYTILYILKLLWVILMPILYFKVLVVLLRRYVSVKALNRLAPFVLICLVLMVFLKEYRPYFSVASWLAYYLGLSAHNVSITLCLVGILLKEAKRNKIRYLPFFFLAAVVHPAMGLFGMLFYALFLIPEFKKEVKAFLPILVSTLLAVVLVKLVFASEQSLPTSEFIDIYVKERHPWHYSVPDFRNLKGDWEIFFVLMNLLFIIPFLYGLRRKRKILWLLALCTWVSYSGAIAVQYVFIDVIPVKLIAYLGVSRFTTFGYWMLVVLWALLLADHIKKEQALVFPSLPVKNFAILIINLIFVGIVFMDNPREVHYNNRKDYYDFVQRTPKEAIFSTYSRTLNTDMRIIGRRGVFISDEFPFTEKFSVEYAERRKSIYGSFQNDTNGIDFYRELQPKDFIEISKKYQLDYILIENGFDSEFANNTPVWKNNRHSLYSIKSLSE